MTTSEQTLQKLIGGAVEHIDRLLTNKHGSHASEGDLADIRDILTGRKFGVPEPLTNIGRNLEDRIQGNEKRLEDLEFKTDDVRNRVWKDLVGFVDWKLEIEEKLDDLETFRKSLHYIRRTPFIIPENDKENKGIMDHYKDRINLLSQISEEEGFINGPTVESQRDFYKFIKIYKWKDKDLFMDAQGHLQIYFITDEYRIRLAFPGDGNVEYVLLFRNDPPRGISGSCKLSRFMSAEAQRDIISFIKENTE